MSLERARLLQLRRLFSVQFDKQEQLFVVNSRPKKVENEEERRELQHEA